MPAAGEAVGEAAARTGVGELIGDGLEIGLGDASGLGDGVNPFADDPLLPDEFAGVGLGFGCAGLAELELAAAEDEGAAVLFCDGCCLPGAELPALLLTGAVFFEPPEPLLPVVLAPRSACRSIDLGAV